MECQLTHIRPPQASRSGRRTVWPYVLGAVVLAWLLVADVHAAHGQAPGPPAGAPGSAQALATSADAPFSPAQNPAELERLAETWIQGDPENWTSREGLTSSIKIVLLLTVLSVAPAVLLMTTSFVRVIVVLGLLRQALGTQQLPPSQVLTSIALFITLLIMTPVWTDVYQNAIVPYTAPNSSMSMEEAWSIGIKPIREFMINQIDFARNGDDILLFYPYLPEGTPEPRTYADVPLQVLLPAYMLSELKTAFLIGFQIYLPFLILDIVIASVTISMGMLMLPPVLISLPFKLMLFVLVDGWSLVVEMLLHSFVPYG